MKLCAYVTYALPCIAIQSQCSLMKPCQMYFSNHIALRGMTDSNKMAVAVMQGVSKLKRQTEIKQKRLSMTQFMLERLLTWKGLQLMGLHNWAGTNAVPTLASFSSVPSCPFDNLKNSWHSLCFYFRFYFTITISQLHQIYLHVTLRFIIQNKSQNISSDFFTQPHTRTGVHVRCITRTCTSPGPIHAMPLHFVLGHALHCVPPKANFGFNEHFHWVPRIS